MSDIFFVQKVFKAFNSPDISKEPLSKDAFKRTLDNFFKVKNLLNIEKEVKNQQRINKYKKHIEKKYAYYYKCFFKNCKQELSTKRGIILHLMNHVSFKIYISIILDHLNAIILTVIVNSQIFET
jgi:hypothetical protein